jgi:hypothetical protein
VHVSYALEDWLSRRHWKTSAEAGERLSLPVKWKVMEPLCACVIVATGAVLSGGSTTFHV